MPPGIRSASAARNRLVTPFSYADGSCGIRGVDGATALPSAITLAATFDPYAPRAQPVYDPHDAFFVPVAGFEGVRRPGPRLTLYRVVR